MSPTISSSSRRSALRHRRPTLCLCTRPRQVRSGGTQGGDQRSASHHCRQSKWRGCNKGWRAKRRSQPGTYCRVRRAGEGRCSQCQGCGRARRCRAGVPSNNLHRIEPLLAKQFVTVDQVDLARTLESPALRPRTRPDHSSPWRKRDWLRHRRNTSRAKPPLSRAISRCSRQPIMSPRSNR